MKSVTTVPVVPSRRWPLLPVCLVIVLATLLSLHRVEDRLPASLWWQALVAPSPTDLRQLLVHYRDLPRIAVAWLCAAALGLAGVASPQGLRTPLAEPMTLGLFSRS